MTTTNDQSSREQAPQLVRVVNKTDYLAIEDTRTGEELRCFSLRELAIAALFAEGYNEAMAIAEQRTRAMRDALHALMEGSEYVTIQGDTDWHTISMPKRAALEKARLALLPPTAVTAEEAGREGEAKDAALTERQISAGGRELCNRAAEACEVDREDYWKTYGNEYIEDFRAAYLAAMKLPPAPAQSGGQGNG